MGSRSRRLGAGEILLTSMDKDGTKSGFDLEMLNRVAEVVDVPIIASGGAGNIEDIVEVFERQQRLVHLQPLSSTSVR